MLLQKNLGLKFEEEQDVINRAALHADIQQGHMPFLVKQESSRIV